MAKALVDAAERDGQDPNYGRSLFSPMQALRMASMFCGKCGTVTESGDHEDDPLCVVSEVLIS